MYSHNHKNMTAINGTDVYKFTKKNKISKIKKFTFAFSSPDEFLF